MDYKTITDLIAQGANIALRLVQTNHRGITRFELTADLPIKTRSKRSQVVYSHVVDTARTQATIMRKIDFHGLSVVAQPLAASPISVCSSSAAGDVRQSFCVICKKSNFDDATGCHSFTRFTPAVGDWLCNLRVSQ
jgi:hypothetical protein